MGDIIIQIPGDVEYWKDEYTFCGEFSVKEYTKILDVLTKKHGSVRIIEVVSILRNNSLSETIKEEGKK